MIQLSFSTLAFLVDTFQNVPSHGFLKTYKCTFKLVTLPHENSFPSNNLVKYWLPNNTWQKTKLSSTTSQDKNLVYILIITSENVENLNLELYIM